MEVVIEVTTAGDREVQLLVVDQEAEVMARYGVGDPGPGVAADSPCLIARVEARPVGCVALGRLSDSVGELKRMYVVPDARGLRVGRLLLRAVERLAASHGFQILRLEAGTQQPEALRLYGRSGWSRIECYGYFQDDPTTICYEKILQP